jgi:acyl-CoA thioesterase-1
MLSDIFRYCRLYGFVFAALLLASGCARRDGGDFTILCFGDSLAEGRGARTTEAWPALLQKRVKAKVINAGQSGDTTEDALARIGEALSPDPDLVIVEFGANDLLEAMNEARAPDFAGMADHLAAILGELRREGRKLYLVKFYTAEMVTAFPEGAAMLPVLEGLYDSAAAVYGAEIIDSTWEGIWGDQRLMADNIHPNAKGYEIMAENYLKAMWPFLKERALLP